jgi:predicted CXXCH cytochrome family protein
VGVLCEQEIGRALAAWRQEVAMGTSGVFGRVSALALLAAGMVSCVDKQQALAPSSSFETPPAAAKGFLGYADTVARKPICGNCHVGKLAEWQGTAHSHAWADLQASGQATSSCEACHATDALGNFVADSLVGFDGTHSARYEDVQCEACHGPGLQHVTNPDASQPLASMLVGTGLTNGCGECHHTAQYPFLEEWSQSEHGMVTHQSIAVNNGEPCIDCHTGDGALRSWGIEVDYLEKDSLGANDGHLAIVCAVCHDPHDATNEKQLRFPISVPSVADNLCMKCHHYRAVPDVTSSRGPMSPQGPLLLGSAGWRSPDFGPADTTIHGTHASSANTRLCATCHVARLPVTDASGAVVFNSTGHLFVAIPCLDATGKPTADDTCDESQRSFDACTASGCHGSPDAARFAYDAATQRIDALVAEVNAMVAEVPASEFNTSDGVITTGEGAKFNAALGAMAGSPIHNPFLMEELLTASIKQLQKDYGIAPAAGVSLQNILPGETMPR